MKEMTVSGGIVITRVYHEDVREDEMSERTTDIIMAQGKLMSWLVFVPHTYRHQQIATITYCYS